MRANDRLPSAFERLRFGASRTLNVRDALLSGAEAATRTERWLRARQVDQGGEVLIITGRGAGSPDGVAVVKAAVLKLLRRLRRAGVVSEINENTPGSFIVRVAPLRALLEASSRPRVAPTPGRDRATLAGLDTATQDSLRRLAVRALESLGIAVPSPAQVDSEMARQFSLLAQGAPLGPSLEWLRLAADRAVREFDDGT